MANRRESAWIVLAAACALAVHLFLAGFATAAVAGTRRRHPLLRRRQYVAPRSRAINATITVPPIAA